MFVRIAIVFAALLLVSLPGTTCYSQELLTSYQARLSKRDHFSSKGTRLTTAPAIIRQDRANFHVLGLRDPEDEPDQVFDTLENRQALEELLNRGQIDSETMAQIVSGTPLVRVEVYRRDDSLFANVRLVSEQQPPQERRKPPTERPEPKKVPIKAGSGFMVSNDGFLLTNYHVVKGCEALEVRNWGPATVREIDPTTDLALLKVQGDTTAAKFRATSPDLAEAVFAVGFPLPDHLGIGGLNFTSGTVSSLSGPKRDTRYLQFSAPVQGGNSGGPLVDGNGLVVGVVTSQLIDQPEEHLFVQNVNFAVRGELARAFLASAGIEPIVGEPKSLSGPAIAKSARAYTTQIICYGTRSAD
jgi:S1-C subfamily serine protease